MAARSLRIGVLAIVAFAGGLILARALMPTHVELPPTERASVLPEPRPLPSLTLTNQDGQPLAPDFFKGHWTFVFFGFTACPDICPTTLATLKQVVRALADLPAAEQPRVLLITVDPERDDAARLSAYVRFFDPAFLGATGSAQDIAGAAQAFGVPYSKVSLPDGGYTMDHGSGLFVVGPSGGIVAYSSAPHDAPAIARDFRKIVSFVESRS
ncbi:MAG: SCO family protein [Gammaproteobacteria bacterium]|nr:SCO family protein [Gammaproteobacteria bacterium]